MKRFLKRIGLFFGVPFIVLLVIFLVTDPFRTLHPFSLKYFSKINREYFSTELFLYNDSIYHYNSFVFGSSQCCGINTFHWKHYLPEGASQYLFQAWGETVTGIAQKVAFLDQRGSAIDHALVVLDIPGSFVKKQLSFSALSIKSYRITGMPRWVYQGYLFFGFAQSPSKWLSSIQQCLDPELMVVTVDTISNDWSLNNRNCDIGVRPPKGNLANSSPKSKAVFFKQIEGKTDADLRESDPLITEDLLDRLKEIKAVFDKHHTDYRIMISPSYCYVNPSINHEDLRLLQELFGADKVFNYTGKNDITVDYNNFTDPNHFGLCAGWDIIEDIYNK